ncbi:sensor histidine kinase [Flindersiella endophytica]
MIAALLNVLLGPGAADVAVAKGRWWRLPLRAIGPGSVPLALILFGAANPFIRHNYVIEARWYSLPIAVAQALPVVLAAYRPLLAWAIEFAAFWFVAATVVPIQQPQPWPWITTGLLAYFVVQYAVARRHGPAIALLSWTIPLLAGILLSLNKNIPESRPNLQLVSILSALLLVLGSAVRMSARARQRLLEEERLTAEERSRRRMLEERTRIARELHDVVAHHMSVITVQASTAEYRLPDLPEAAREEFRSISDQARESLTEMRRLLTVLRSEDEATLRAPQPGLDRLDDLLESAKRAGTAVSVVRKSVPADLPEPVSLTAYRIVQEALSNVVRHASGAATALTLTGSASELRIDVVNDPPPPTSSSAEPRSAPGEPGLGLAGMRERVALLGGSLEAAVTPEGGFAVRAVLPTAEEASVR